MRIATWNVNSIKQRLPRVLEFLERHHPDVLCLQETKSTAAAFPHLDLQAAGYTAVEHGSGRWAGVAILAPTAAPPEAVVRGLPGEPCADEARWIEATVAGVRIASVYVPNGRAPDHPVFADKLRFLDALTVRAGQLPRPCVIAGDFNIAPGDLDVYDPARYVGSTHTSAAERGRLAAIRDTGLVDAFRACHPQSQQFSWWDYRAGHFHKNLGMRIDLFLASPDLLDGTTECGFDRDFRKGAKPSDHAPILLRTRDG